ncbi:hypothetical protein [Streptomyces alkaliterrae]|uniref:Uncharacterized protein n=1 Tax=Streptomyces alkaliterrae TaxID=2213162 RepID=A0A5P0YJN9_9ACTN|nr:hypothetical protein [Streptomyces alkaliterrae]MBB1262184.1 hypothetical protein [Streptomyces alkaliterrae]MQS00526.1 hypothetical protein [Streptomyces alkaliterrae]
MLADRAGRFVRSVGRWTSSYDDECPWPGEGEWAEAAEVYGEERVSRCRDVLRDVRVLGGLRYDSLSWSLEETVTFWPELDIDPDDGFPAVSLIEHSAAHPFGVWLDEEGVVRFMAGSEAGGEYVAVFPTVSHLIASDAVHAECARWTEVERGGPDGVPGLEALLQGMRPLGDASGWTEGWWEADGVRAHLWRTFSHVFDSPELVLWRVWVRDEEARATLRAMRAARL